jgi:hypothetical protein
MRMTFAGLAALDEGLELEGMKNMTTTSQPLGPCTHHSYHSMVLSCNVCEWLPQTSCEPQRKRQGSLFEMVKDSELALTSIYISWILLSSYFGTTLCHESKMGP